MSEYTYHPIWAEAGQLEHLAVRDVNGQERWASADEERLWLMYYHEALEAEIQRRLLATFAEQADTMARRVRAFYALSSQHGDYALVRKDGLPLTMLQMANLVDANVLLGASIETWSSAISGAAHKKARAEAVAKLNDKELVAEGL